MLEDIVLSLAILVFIIAGNHDSPGRLHFGSKMMERNGLHIVGKFEKDRKPAILQDEYGEVHFHFVPFCEDRKSTRLNSSHVAISYAVFCLKKHMTLNLQ